MPTELEQLQENFRALLDALKEAKISRKDIKQRLVSGFSESFLARLYARTEERPEVYEDKINRIKKAFEKEYDIETKKYKEIKDDPSQKASSNVSQTDLELASYRDLSRKSPIFSKSHDSKIMRVLDTWIDTHDIYQVFLESKIEKIEILVLNPASSLLEERVKQLPNENFKNRYDNIVQFLEHTLHDKPNVTIRLYDELPSLNCYIFDHVIYFGPYLSFDASQKTFFQSVNNNNDSDNYIAKQINQHFDTIWERSKELDSVMIEDLKAHRNATLNAYQVFKGSYVMYNTDENPDTLFQTSFLEVDAASSKCILTYAERKDGTLHKRPGTIKLLDAEHHVLLTFAQGSFLLEILGYYQRPRFFQGVYIHTDERDRPRAAFCVIEKRDDADTEEIQASRKAENIPVNVREYLFAKSAGGIQITETPRKLNDLRVPRSANYNLVNRYIGEWYLYYNVRFPKSAELIVHPFISEIGRSRLEIIKNEQTGEITCKLNAHDGSTFKGIPISDYLSNSNNVLGFLLYYSDEEENENARVQVLQLLFKVEAVRGRSSHLDGTYNITYANNNVIGCGLALLKEANGKPLPLGSYHPMDIDNGVDKEIRQNSLSIIPAYLSQTCKHRLPCTLPIIKARTIVIIQASPLKKGKNRK